MAGEPTSPLGISPLKTHGWSHLRADTFRDLEWSVLPNDITELRYARDSSYGQMVVLIVSGFAFMFFVVSILPLLKLSAAENTLWTLIGLVVLVGLGVITQAVLNVTVIHLSEQGIAIEQGTPTDREEIEIAWSELSRVELEPVDEKDGRKGMQLRLLPHQGDPVDLLPGIDIGDLTTLRRVLQAEVLARRGMPPLSLG